MECVFTRLPIKIISQLSDGSTKMQTKEKHNREDVTGSAPEEGSTAYMSGGCRSRGMNLNQSTVFSAMQYMSLKRDADNDYSHTRRAHTCLLI